MDYQGATQTVLVVDDDRDTAEMVKLLLETLPERYRIQTAPNGREALEFVRAHDADLILLDVMMPEMDGIETYRQIKQIPKPIAPAVFFLTAKAGRSDIIEGLKLGADDYIEKPFDPQILCQKVQTRLQKVAELKRTFFIDTLTQVYAGHYFLEKLSEACCAAARYGRAFALLFIDLDRFKAVNDTYGHLVGDEYLRFAAKLMKGFFRQSDTVARYGGDEFCVLLPEAGTEQAGLVVARLKEHFLQKRFKTGGIDLAVGLSVGFSVFGPKADTPQILIQEADAAMYRDKQSGRAQPRS